MDARSHTIYLILHAVVGNERATEGDEGPHTRHVTSGKDRSVLRTCRLCDPWGGRGKQCMGREELLAGGE